MLPHGVLIINGPDPEKALVIPDGSPIFVNTRFLPWQNFTGLAPLPPPPPGLGGSYKELPQCFAVSIFVGPSKLHHDAPTTTLARTTSSLTFLLTHHCWFRLLSRWFALGLFNAPLADEDELLQKMKQVYQPAAAGTPDPFLLAAIDFDQSADNWGAGGLPTRPPAFEFLHEVSILSLYRAAENMPLAAVCALARVLGSV